jgi:succinyl-CoA synthetase beta subunit
MDLLEYQVKEWFDKAGIPVLPSQKIEHPTDLKRLNISYPIVLKSQVHADERIKAGGVKIVETTIDAIAAAQNIFNSPIWGELPEILLAEAKYEAQNEFYLGIVLDTAICRPVLLGCQEADINWESLGDKMQYVVVEEEFSPFYARRLGLKMGLKGSLIQSVSDILAKMYQLFVQKDLDLIEINPLAVNASGKVMALNGQVRVNERAINRHPEIAQIAEKIINRHKSGKRESILNENNGVEMRGDIGILGNGTGSVLTTLDAVYNGGGKPGASLNLRHSFLADTENTTFCDRLETGLKILAADKNIRVILINFLGTIPEVNQMSQVITNFIQLDPQDIQTYQSNGNKNNSKKLPYLVMRLAGADYDDTRKYLEQLKLEPGNLIVVESLEEAVKQSVSLGKSQKTGKQETATKSQKTTTRRQKPSGRR